MRLHQRTWQRGNCATNGLAIHSDIDLLARFPEQGRTGRKPDTRELVLGGLPYIAMYRIRKDTVEILRILHGAQIWP